MLLVLFDVDGTLFVSHDPLVGRATFDAIEAVYGVRVPADGMAHVDHAGRTARWITRRLLRNAGVGNEEAERGLERWCDAVSARYLELLPETDTSGWQAPDGAAEALDRIRGFARIALLTGNPEPIARARMELLGLADFFPAGQGAFGCEADGRAELIALARDRAGGWPAERTVEVGDTPADVADAKAAGALSVAVLWWRCGRDELTGADVFVDSMEELADVLERLGRLVA